MSVYTLSRVLGFPPRIMISFDETYTDTEFQENLQKADADWMGGVARKEPDLAVEGLRGSFMSKFLELFSGRKR